MTAIVQAGANQPLSFTVGDDVSLRLTVTENSVAYDWTGATVTTSIIANGAAVATNFTTATSAGGILDLSLTDTETTTLGLGTFDYWVKVTKASVTSTWVAGQLTMHDTQYGAASNLSSSLSITTAPSTTLAITLSGYAYLSHGTLITSNGTTATAIQALIDGLDTSKQYLIVPPGTITLNASLTLRSDLTIIGTGSGASTQSPRTASTLKLANGVNASMFIQPDGVTGIHIIDVRLEGNKANQSGTSHGIELPAGAVAQDAWLSLTRCHISGFLTDGINAAVKRRCIHVLDSYIFQCGRHGFYTNASDNTITNSLIGLNADCGVRFDTAVNQRIQCCDIFTNGTGVYADGGGDISGIWIGGGTSIDRNVGTGLYLDAGSAVVDGVTFNANSNGTAGKNHIEVKNTLTNIVRIINCTFDHNATDVPVRQEGYSVLFSGTTGPVVYDGNHRYSRADNLGLSNVPASLVPYGSLQSEVFVFAVGDETTPITTGTAKVTWRMPFAFNVTAVRASLATASSSGLPTVDIMESGVTILSTKLSIDATELTSKTAATAAVISDSGLADDAPMRIDITVAGTGAAGLKVYVIGTRA